MTEDEYVESYKRLAVAAMDLANEAARAVTEPRRFHENEDNRQQELSARVSRVRHILRGVA